MKGKGQSCRSPENHVGATWLSTAPDTQTRTQAHTYMHTHTGRRPKRGRCGMVGRRLMGFGREEEAAQLSSSISQASLLPPPRSSSQAPNHLASAPHLDRPASFPTCNAHAVERGAAPRGGRGGGQRGCMGANSQERAQQVTGRRIPALDAAACSVGCASISAPSNTVCLCTYPRPTYHTRHTPQMDRRTPHTVAHKHDIKRSHRPHRNVPWSAPA